jgi:hypothetical protein
MGRSTQKGVVQVRVIADPDQTESLSGKLIEMLESIGFTVIQCSSDYPDKFDDGRRKFHVTAMPNQQEKTDETD